MINWLVGWSIINSRFVERFGLVWFDWVWSGLVVRLVNLLLGRSELVLIGLVCCVLSWSSWLLRAWCITLKRQWLLRWAMFVCALFCFVQFGLVWLWFWFVRFWLLCFSFGFGWFGSVPLGWVGCYDDGPV